MMENEKRLIDANAFLDAIKERHDDIMNDEIVDKATKWRESVCFGSVVNVLVKMTTEDAVPVVHGRWEAVQETEMYVPDMKFTITKTTETCSACKARIGFVGAKRYLFDAICPNCGAKMDGGKEDGK